MVVKSRDVGEPAPRLCKAEMQHRGNTQLPRLLASAIWADLPGEPRWALFDEVGTSVTAGAKLHRPASGGSQLAPCSLKAQGTLSSCTALYVAHMPNVSAPALRKPYLGKIRRREREGAKLWRRSARAEAIGREAPTCPADIARQTVVAPRLYTSQGLRAALASSVCSRACAASRLRGLDANRTRRAGEPQPCLLGGEQAGCDLRRGNVLLVVSHLNADLRHLREQPFCYVVFEKQGNAQKHVIDFFSVANKANEASTYLHFLLHFVDELCPRPCSSCRTAAPRPTTPTSSASSSTYGWTRWRRTCLSTAYTCPSCPRQRSATSSDACGPGRRAPVPSERRAAAPPDGRGVHVPARNFW